MQFYINNLIVTIPLLLIIVLLIFDNIIQKRKRIYFLLAIISTLIECVMEVQDRIMISMEWHNIPVVTRVINFAGFIFGTASVFFLLMLVVQNTKFEGKWFLTIPFVVDIALNFASIWFGLIFYIDNENIYHRGPLYSVHIAILVINFLAVVFCDLSKKRRYLPLERFCVSVNYVLISVAFVVQMLLPKYVVTSVSISMFLIFYYVLFQSNLLKHDSLTGIFSRRMYDKSLAKLNGKKSVTIINVDVNSFKKINDMRGNKFGDEVLARCGRTLQSYFAKYGFTYRVGGDEFCIICQHLENTMIEAIFEVIEGDLIDLKVQIGEEQLLAFGYEEYAPNENDDIYNSIKKAQKHMQKYKISVKNA